MCLALFPREKRIKINDCIRLFSKYVCFNVVQSNKTTLKHLLNCMLLSFVFLCVMEVKAEA